MPIVPTQSSMLHVRLDSDLKAQATETLAAMGLSTADAVRLLFHRVVADQAFPLELKVPNSETQAAIEEGRAMMKAHNLRFATAQDLFDSLDGRVL
jgi:DNA-damage-inducible protein J